VLPVEALARVARGTACRSVSIFKEISHGIT
jgi:hypothetical protein